MNAPRRPAHPAHTVHPDLSDADRSPSPAPTADGPDPRDRRRTGVQVGRSDSTTSHVVTLRRLREEAAGRSHYRVECPVMRIPVTTWSLVLPPAPELEEGALSQALRAHLRNCPQGLPATLEADFDPDDPSFFAALGLMPAGARTEPTSREDDLTSSGTRAARYPRVPHREWRDLVAAHPALHGVPGAARARRALERSADWCALEAEPADPERCRPPRPVHGPGDRQGAGYPALRTVGKLACPWPLGAVAGLEFNHGRQSFFAADAAPAVV